MLVNILWICCWMIESYVGLGSLVMDNICGIEKWQFGLILFLVWMVIYMTKLLNLNC